MSMHKTPLTKLEEDGLLAHGLSIDKPSQLSDCFRAGLSWALNNTCTERDIHNPAIVAAVNSYKGEFSSLSYGKKVYKKDKSNWHTCSNLDLCGFTEVCTTADFNLLVQDMCNHDGAASYVSYQKQFSKYLHDKIVRGMNK